MLIMLSLSLQSSYAIQKEVVTEINGRSLTNIEVFENLTLTYGSHTDLSNYKPYSFEYEIDRIVPIILFEQYLEKNGIKSTDQDVADALKKNAARAGKRSVEEYLKGGFSDPDKAEESKRRLYRMQYEGIVESRAVRHFDPNVYDVNEEEIQKYVASYKENHFPPTIGKREAILCRGFAMDTDNLKKNEPLAKEFFQIKERLDDGEDFNTVAMEYTNREADGIFVGVESTWIVSKEFKRQGMDALVPWGALKGKTILANFGPRTLILRVEDHIPSSRMDIAKAAKDKYLRQEVIDGTKGYKFQIAESKLLMQLKSSGGGIRYKGNKKAILEKMAEQYKQYRLEKHNDDPNSKKR